MKRNNHNKSVGKKILRPNPARPFRVVQDSLIIDSLYQFTLGCDEDDIISTEYDSDSTQQFSPSHPYIGCGNRHKSIIADFPDDLANALSITSRQALYS